MQSAPSAPLDIKREWLNLTRRVQSALTHNNGFAVVTVTVLVGPDNTPVAWSSPEVKLIEPRANAGEALMSVVNQLCKID